MAGGTLVPRDPTVPLASGVRSLNHWTPREVPKLSLKGPFPLPLHGAERGVPGRGTADAQAPRPGLHQARGGSSVRGRGGPFGSRITDHGRRLGWLIQVQQ